MTKGGNKKPRGERNHHHIIFENDATPCFPAVPRLRRMTRRNLKKTIEDALKTVACYGVCHVSSPAALYL